MNTTVQALNTLPIRILQQIGSSSSRNKAELVADIAFSLDFHGIVLNESVIDSDFVVIKFNGEKLAGLDRRRGRQEFQLPSGEWSTDWTNFIPYMLVLKRGVQAVQEADAMQDEYEDETDPSVSQDERNFIREYGELAERIIEVLGTHDNLELVQDDRGEFRICDEDRDFEPVIWTNADTRLWGTSVYQWGQRTPMPLEHLKDYVNRK